MLSQLKHKPMIRFLLLAFLCIIISNSCLAQIKEQSTTEALTKIEVMTPGISHELPVGDIHTIRAKLSVLSVVRSAVVFSDRFQTGVRSHWFPVVDLQYRRYSNLTKRKDKGKRSAQNSGNYLALKTIAYLPEQFNNFELDDSIWLGPIWGMQRQFSDRWSLDFAAGLGYEFRFRTDNRPFPLVTFNLGYLLLKKD